MRTIKELIEYLKQFDENMAVCKAGYEGNLEYFERSQIVKVYDSKEGSDCMGDLNEARGSEEAFNTLALFGRTH